MPSIFSTVWPTRQARVVAATLGVVAIGLAAVVVRQAEWAGLVAGRLAGGRKPRLEDYVLGGEWHAALVSAGLCLMLALTARYWAVARPLVVGGRDGAAGRGGRWFWLLLVVVVVFGGWLRAPRLEHSLYNDEEYAFRRYVAGEHKRMDDGSREWRPVSWLVTIWGNQMANNSPPYSALSRAAYDWAVARGEATVGRPAEVPLRVPALAAGLGSVAAIGLLARRLGGAWSGVAAALLAALHPWHVRYSTEARGHSFVLLLAPLLLLALARAVESGRWRWWVLFGATEVGLLWSFAGSIHYVVAINFLALIWLWRSGGGRWMTFLAVHTMAGIVYLHLMAPCFPQMREALAKFPVFSTGLGASWFATTGSFLIAGMPWANANPEIASHPSLGGWWAEEKLVLIAVIAWVFLVLGLGVRRVWASPWGRIQVLALPLAGALAVGATLIGRTVLFSWYVLYLLPGGLVLAGVGLREALTLVPHRWGRAGVWLPRAAVILACAAWISVIDDPLRTYRRMGKQSLREVARMLKQPIDGVEPIHGLHASEAGTYDPSLNFIDANPEALESLIAQAEAEHRPLLVAYGYRATLASHAPEFLRAIEDSGRFERVAHFPGLEVPLFAHHVWRYRREAER